MMRRIGFAGSLAAGIIAFLPGPCGWAQVSKPAASARAVATADAVPARRLLQRLPQAAFDAAAPFAAAPAPVGRGGYAGPARTARPWTGARVPAMAAERAPAPIKDHGIGNRSTIYHYSDKLVPAELDDDAPWRWAGRFTFITAAGSATFCSGALISSSIMLTAGHCVHQGGDWPARPKEAGWVTAGTYAPAFRDGVEPYGTATASEFFTTTGWYEEGLIDQGYDVALVVLNKRGGTPREIGADTGWFGFCHTNCLQPYNHLSQLGYPENYYRGAQMTQSEHLERSNLRDFLFGTGMRGGSSGGPHIANLGEIDDAAGVRGRLPDRNWIFAVTSWGYTDEGLKLQGASSLSGPANGNAFKRLFNLACTRARELHGFRSCTLL